MGTYWNHEGAHQAAYEKLYGELVPSQGQCQTLEGRLIPFAPVTPDIVV